MTNPSQMHGENGESSAMSAVLDGLAEPRLLLNENGRVEAFNTRAADLLGLSELNLGLPLIELVPDAERSRLLPWWSSGENEITLDLASEAVTFERSALPNGHFELFVRQRRDSDSNLDAVAPNPTSLDLKNTITGALPLWITTVLAAENRPEVFALVKALGPVLDAPFGCLFLRDGSALTPSAEWGGIVAVRDTPISTHDAWALRLGQNLDSRQLAEGVTNRHVVTAHDEFTYCALVIAGGELYGLLTTRHPLSAHWFEDSARAQETAASVIGQVLVRLPASDESEPTRSKDQPMPAPAELDSTANPARGRRQHEFAYRQ